MRKIITAVLVIILCCVLTACSKKAKDIPEISVTAEEEKTKFSQLYTMDDPDASELIAYFGVRAQHELEEIPTFAEYLLSQEKCHISDFAGTNHIGGNDSRRLFFKTEIEEIVLEYESGGEICEMNLEIEEVEPGLYRVDPYRRIYLFSGGEEWAYSDYETFKIKSGGKMYYMTWIPPVIVK